MNKWLKLVFLFSLFTSTSALSSSDEQVNGYIEENINSLIIPPRDFLLYGGITPSLVKDHIFQTNRRIITGVYTDMYDWDAHFISLTLLGIDSDRYEPAVQNAILSFLALQSPEGFTPRTISYDGIKDFPGHHKPFLFQSVLALHKQGKGLNWLQDNYQGFSWRQNFSQITDPALWTEQEYQEFFSKTEFVPLERLENYLAFFDGFRKVPGQGLYAWANIVESGIDTTLALRPRVYAPVGDITENLIHQISPVPRIAAIDLSVYLYNEFLAASKVFEILGQTKKAQQYNQKATTIKESFINTFWHAEEQLFYNHYFKSDGTEEFINIPSWTSFLPLTAPNLIDDPTIAKLIIEKHLLSKTAFMSPYGIRSLSRKSPVQGGDSGRALVPEYWFEAANWNGPIWILPNIFAIQILEKYNYQAEATKLQTTINDLLAKDLLTNQMMHEQYSYIDGKPGWAEDFMSWNTCMWLINTKSKNLHQATQYSPHQ